jgi:hypothetical protein
MRRFISHVQTALLALSLTVFARTSAAQLATSLEIGLPATLGTSPAALLIGVRVGSNPFKPFVPGIDWSMEVAPVYLVARSGLDLTYPISLACKAILTPRAGVSALWTPEDGAAAGYNVGAGFVARTGPRVAVRVDITQDWFRGQRFDTIVTMGFVVWRSAKPATSPPALPHASVSCLTRPPSPVLHPPVS